MTNELIAHAEFLVEWATALRLNGNDKVANEKLRQAAEEYEGAGDTEMAEACRKMIDWKDKQWFPR